MPPMQIIISDSCCLIDLQKASLLEAFVHAPYEVCVPDVIFESELLSFSTEQKRALQDTGLRVLELPGGSILSVQNLRRENPALSVNDCFACILAQKHTGSILLTGDGNLRKTSEDLGIEVHGILWCLDVMYAAQTATAQQIHQALSTFKSDATVRLPARSLESFIKKYGDLL